MNIMKFLLSVIIIGVYSCTLLAQSTITFNLNLKPQIEDSIFVPGQDKVKLIGNQFPLSSYRTKELTDSAPIDSIYSVEISFSRTLVNKSLQYNFIMLTENGETKEQRPRVITIRNEDAVLDAIYFNAFAW
jgi:hypothetical protein